MSNSSEFYSNFKNQILLSINTCMPCEVLSYNEGSRTAKIQPLFMVKEVNRSPEKLSVLEDVPVLFERVKINNGQEINVTIPEGEHGGHSGGDGKHVHTKLKFEEEVENVPVLKNGDVVLVVFAQRSIDDAAEGKLVYPGASRLFDIHDAIIVGLL